MSRLTPAAAATSSMDVAAKPRSAKASLAAVMRAARRSAAGSRRRGLLLTNQVYTLAYTPAREEARATGLDRSRTARDAQGRRAAARRGRQVPRRLRRRRQLRVAAHQEPLDGDRQLEGRAQE